MRVAGLFICMNILRTITAKPEISPQIRKLQAACKKCEDTCPVTIAKDELKEKLSPLQYHVTQDKATERPYSGQYIKWNEEGIFTCIVCGNQLFRSDDKFASGCGWPAFSDIVEKGNVKLQDDTSHGAVRMEVRCADCGAHLGHVFDDGPKPSGIRYCVNSASLDFRKHTTV